MRQAKNTSTLAEMTQLGRDLLQAYARTKIYTSGNIALDMLIAERCGATAVMSATSSAPSLSSSPPVSSSTQRVSSSVGTPQSSGVGESHASSSVMTPPEGIRPPTPKDTTVSTRSRLTRIPIEGETAPAIVPSSGDAPRPE